MIELKNINHFYGKFHSLKNVSMKVPPGSITGLIGQNGAGKSTLLKILAGFLVPETGRSGGAGGSGDDGEVFVDGLSYRKEPMAVRSRIGYMPETPLLYREMKVVEYLDFVGKLKRLNKEKRASECERLIRDCGLGQIYHKLIGSLSKGNRQRVALAQALLGEPRVLLLDEPTSALDPAQAIEIRRIIQGQKGKPPGGGGAVLMSSHVLSEISAVCDRVIFISSGEIRFEGSIDSFKGKSLESLFA
ncbi:MAG: ABC transporter ATP-binding protein [Deltaproteobacteria bacterium]|nr:ABC transporter ATP-binding protein [Deltaproteobacteria bacterium]